MSFLPQGFQSRKKLLQEVKKHSIACGRQRSAPAQVDGFARRMCEFCPGRQIGGLVLNTPNLAADGWGHSAWSAEECRRASAEGGFFGCAMNVRHRIYPPAPPQSLHRF